MYRVLNAAKKLIAREFILSCMTNLQMPGEELSTTIPGSEDSSKIHIQYRINTTNITSLLTQQQLYPQLPASAMGCLKIKRVCFHTREQEGGEKDFFIDLFHYDVRSNFRGQNEALHLLQALTTFADAMVIPTSQNPYWPSTPVIVISGIHGRGRSIQSATRQAALAVTRPQAKR